MDAETKKMLTEILEAVNGLESRISAVEVESAAATPAQSRRERKTSIKEFLMECGPSDGVQMTLAVGYYLETSEGMDSFNKADIEKGFRSAKEKPPVNINDKVNMCIKNGHMMEAESKKDSMKAWTLTRSGEETVKTGFKKEKH